mmetsp:Transcript_723/g.1473  ORF Transcript_723/g.1473 Transcript_723/m.1473 type:complete len:84 (+) Transcript_723:586-837(+)
MMDSLSLKLSKALALCVLSGYVGNFPFPSSVIRGRTQIHRHGDRTLSLRSFRSSLLGDDSDFSGREHYSPLKFPAVDPPPPSP